VGFRRMNLSLAGEQLPLSSFFTSGSQSQKSRKPKRNIDLVEGYKDDRPTKKGRQKENEPPAKPTRVQTKATSKPETSSQSPRRSDRRRRQAASFVAVARKAAVAEQPRDDGQRPVVNGDNSLDGEGPSSTIAPLLTSRGAHVQPRLSTPINKANDSRISANPFPTPPPTSARSRKVRTAAYAKDSSPLTESSSPPRVHKGDFAAPLTPESPSMRTRRGYASQHRDTSPDETPHVSGPSGVEADHGYVPSSCPEAEMSITLSQIIDSQPDLGRFTFAAGMGTTSRNDTPQRSGEDLDAAHFPSITARPYKESRHPEKNNASSASSSQDLFVPSSQTQELTISDSPRERAARPSPFTSPAVVQGRSTDEVVPTSQSQERELSPREDTSQKMDHSRGEMVPTSQSWEEELRIKTPYWTPCETRRIVESPDNIQGPQSNDEKEPTMRLDTSMDAQVSHSSQDVRSPLHDRTDSLSQSVKSSSEIPIGNFAPSVPHNEAINDNVVAPRSPSPGTQTSLGQDSQWFTCPPSVPSTSGSSYAGDSEGSLDMPTQLRTFRDMFASEPSWFENERETGTQVRAPTPSGADLLPPVERLTDEPARRDENVESETESESDSDTQQLTVVQPRPRERRTQSSRPLPAGLFSRSKIPTSTTLNRSNSKTSSYVDARTAKNTDANSPPSQHFDELGFNDDLANILEDSQDQLGMSSSSLSSSQASSIPSDVMDFLDMFSQRNE